MESENSWVVISWTSRLRSPSNRTRTPGTAIINSTNHISPKIPVRIPRSINTRMTTDAKWKSPTPFSKGHRRP